MTIIMWQALVSTASRLLQDLHRAWRNERTPGDSSPTLPNRPIQRRPLRRITLTDEVGRTLFEEYAGHRKGARGDEETGWILLGRREADEAVVLATLPAGAESSAGVAHVLFNSNAQGVGSRIVRQFDRRLDILGVVHTHPGTLRHPSDGDYRGDIAWVRQRKGGEGVFGIGTVDKYATSTPVFARQPRPNVQCMGDMCFSWYSLRDGDRTYRSLPYNITLGPDLARPLHSVWPTIEHHAEPLDRLYRQQAGVVFQVVPGKNGSALSVNVPLAEPGDSVCVLLEGKDARYLVCRKGEILEADCKESRIDRGVYLMLAELTG